ncbi:MAG: tRNA (N(6)-L-threonylcarbamoyladenosine(37)-C(2))-methylthiotransferase MtaB [Acidobacteriia bacterium]|nr:tRNA (N(6)-L-threonylcarbamoyladenosine(37)-C(2))-methylthiotransferase MtaB [Terriglobia bacterium]
MSNFHIINFGCRATQADGGEIEREMLACSFEKAPSMAEAHIVILNTCTVTAAADRDARQTVRRVRRENPRAKIVVTGCYAQRASEEIRQIPGVYCVVGNSHKHLLAQIMIEKLASGLQNTPEVDPAGTDQRPLAPSCTAEVYLDQFTRLERTPFVGQALFASTERTRPSLKIQDGCDANCSFCIIPAVRGRSRSLAPSEVLEQVEALAAGGYKELVLSGIHLGSYGRDLEERTSLLSLLEALENVRDLCRIRLSSIEPLEVSEGVIDHVARSRRFAKHLHVPLQSGVDRILRLMRRPYTADQYAQVVHSIRRKVPDAAIGADVITGFPGETEEEHRATMAFIERSPLTYLHVFSFSPRPGTPAAEMRGEVSPLAIKRRSAELRDLGKRKKFKFQQQMLGKILSVVTLEPRGGEFTGSMSDNFLEVNVAGEAIEPNQIVDVKIEGIVQGMLIGEFVRRTQETFD